MLGGGVFLLISAIICQSFAAVCEWKLGLRDADIYNINGTAKFFTFWTGQWADGFNATVVVPDEIGSGWVDIQWYTETSHGRETLYKGVSVLDKLAVGRSLTFQFTMGYGSAVGTSMDLVLTYNSQDPHNCGQSIFSGASEDQESDRVRVRRSTSESPIWVNLNEISAAEYVFLWPIRSLHNIGTIALAIGTEIGVRHEYLQLSQYERSVYALVVPGLHVSGPSYAHEIESDGQYFQGRQVFRYSKRDAAWVLWDYAGKKPAWNGDHSGPEYWYYRAAPLPVEHKGLVFDHTDV